MKNLRFLKKIIICILYIYHLYIKSLNLKYYKESKIIKCF
jgi:hypothetical protein